MTTELMIAYLLKDWTASGSAPHPGDPILKIIAALKAGQVMRDNLFDTTKEWKLDEALKAWNAATKEEDV